MKVNDKPRSQWHGGLYYLGLFLLCVSVAYVMGFVMGGLWVRFIL